MLTQAQRAWEQRAIKQAYGQQRRADSYLADDVSLGSWKVQLNKLGLEIREIPADGFVPFVPFWCHHYNCVVCTAHSHTNRQNSASSKLQYFELADPSDK